MRFVLAVLALIFWIAVVAAIAFGSWRLAVHVDRRLAEPAGGALAEGVVVFVEPGDGARDVAATLQEAGVLDRPLEFLAWTRVSGLAGRLQAGEYRIERPMSIVELADLLASGRVLLHAFTVPEGLDRFETAALLAAEGWWTEDELLAAFGDPAPVAALDPDAPDLEGYLFPETYHFARGTSATEVARAMGAAFVSTWGELDGERRAAELGLGVREVTALASLVEEETSLPQERRLVSSVFHNRLERGMRMEADPTVIHALKLDGLWRGGAIRRSDLAHDSPYNTYVSPGLPPGPIASPGRASLAAALEPARSNLLFFVASGDGGHRFAETAAQHSRNVAKWRRHRAQEQQEGR